MDRSPQRGQGAQAHAGIAARRRARMIGTGGRGGRRVGSASREEYKQWREAAERAEMRSSTYAQRISGQLLPARHLRRVCRTSVKQRMRDVQQNLKKRVDSKRKGQHSDIINYFDVMEDHTMFLEPEDQMTVNMSPHFERYMRYWEWKVAVDCWRAYVPKRKDFYFNDDYITSKVSGLERLKSVYDTLQTISPTRSLWQRKLQHNMVRATLYQILGDDYEAQVDTVCDMNKWDGPKQELMAIASRRSGKTWGTAQYAAAIMLTVPNVEVVIFSLSKRQSQKMLGLVKDFIYRHPDGRKMRDTDNAEEIVLKGPDGDKRSCKSYPGRTDVRIIVLAKVCGWMMDDMMTWCKGTYRPKAETEKGM